MHRYRRFLAAFACCAAPLLVGAAQPVASSFVPALSYRYGSGSTDLRLSNADGSQAVLLARMPLGTGIIHHAIAPLGRREAAFVYVPAPGTNEVRLVDWSQPTFGGPLSVTLDPKPLFTRTGTGVEITSVDYSPDGNTIAVVSWVQGTNQDVRFFDVATRTQSGAAVPLTIAGSNAHYRPVDGSLLMRGGFVGFSSYKDGVQTALFNPGSGGWFDNFNGAATDVVVQNLVNGENTLLRWDGTTLVGPILTTITQGYHASVSCDNSGMIFQRGSRPKTILYSFDTRSETAFSQDGSISQATYPNTCA